MTFNAEFTAIIQTLIAGQGKDAFVNPAKCKAFLPDYTKNEYAKERRLLLKVVEAGGGGKENCRRRQPEHLQKTASSAFERRSIHGGRHGGRCC
jgi:hypothetical protein